MIYGFDPNEHIFQFIQQEFSFQEQLKQLKQKFNNLSINEKKIKKNKIYNEQQHNKQQQFIINPKQFEQKLFKFKLNNENNWNSIILLNIDGKDIKCFSCNYDIIGRSYCSYIYCYNIPYNLIILKDNKLESIYNINNQKCKINEKIIELYQNKNLNDYIYIGEHDENGNLSLQINKNKHIFVFAFYDFNNHEQIYLLTYNNKFNVFKYNESEINNNISYNIKLDEELTSNFNNKYSYNYNFLEQIKFKID